LPRGGEGRKPEAADWWRLAGFRDGFVLSTDLLMVVDRTRVAASGLTRLNVFSEVRALLYGPLPAARRLLSVLKESRSRPDDRTG
jgi:hypothetical protein